MPKPTFQATAEGLPTRRHFLSKLVVTSAVGAVLAGGTVVLANEESAHPDAELLALGEKFKQAWSDERAVYAREKGQCTHESDDRCDAASETTGQFVGKMLECEARTSDGLAVKALAISWCYCGDDIEFCVEPTTDLKLAASIVRDLLAMHSVGSAR